jgi:hypothetical protein
MDRSLPALDKKMRRAELEQLIEILAVWKRFPKFSNEPIARLRPVMYVVRIAPDIPRAR